jgi:hypothetical protein
MIYKDSLRPPAVSFKALSMESPKKFLVLAVTSKRFRLVLRDTIYSPAAQAQSHAPLFSEEVPISTSMRLSAPSMTLL